MPETKKQESIDVAEILDSSHATGFFAIGHYDIKNLKPAFASGSKKSKKQPIGEWKLPNEVDGPLVLSIDLGLNVVLGRGNSGKTTLMNHWFQILSNMGLVGAYINLAEPGGGVTLTKEASKDVMPKGGTQLEDYIAHHAAHLDFIVVDSLSMALFAGRGAAITKGTTGDSLAAFTKLNNIALEHKVAVIGVVNPVVVEQSDVDLFTIIISGRVCGSFLVNEYRALNIRSRAAGELFISRKIKEDQKTEATVSKEVGIYRKPSQFTIPQINKERI